MKILLSFLLLFAFVSPAMAEEHAAKKEEKSEEGGEGAKTPDGPIYVNMQPFVLPVIGDKGPEQLISFIISLEVENQEKADLVKSRMPRLNDAYLQSLYGALDTRSVNKGSLVDVMRVKQKLQAPTERVLGKDVVKDLLIQGVSQRRF